MTQAIGLDEIIKTWCMSDWEGCMCDRPKRHEPPHRCAAATCGCEWTDEQAAEWWETLKAEIPRLKGRDDA